MRHSHGCVLLALALGACPCGADDPRQAAAQALDDLCDAKARTTCSLLARCDPADLDQTPDDCAAVEAQQCREALAAARAAVAAGRATLDTGARDRCLQALSLARCGADAGTIDDWCGAPVVGAVAVGGACYADLECVDGACDKTTCPGACRVAAPGDACGATGQPPCASGFVCDHDQHRCVARRASGACTTSAECAAGLACVTASNDACAGAACACAACGTEGAPCCDAPRCGVGLECVDGLCRAPGSTGDACDYRARVSCQPALVCVIADPSALQGTCGAPAADGGACFFGWECAPDEACRGADAADSVRGVCGVPAGAGDTCRPPAQSATGDCGAGSYCDGTCHALGRAGDSCGTGGSLCESGLWCVPVPGTSDSRCGDLPGAGQPCLSPYFCADGTYCNNFGYCVPLLQAGASCSADAQCASTACQSDRTCQPMRADGEACGGAQQCTSGDCRDGLCRPVCSPSG